MDLGLKDPERERKADRLTKPTSLSIVVPVYNEQDRAPRFLQLFGQQKVASYLRKSSLEVIELLMVDDGSTDSTVAEIAKFKKEIPQLRVLPSSEGNRGKGSAVARGVAEAKGSLTLISDVDLSTPLQDVTKLFDEMNLNHADVAIGSRTVKDAHVEAPSRRKIMGRVFNGYVRTLTKLPYTDTQCGFKLLSTEIARDLTAVQITEGFAYDVELLMRADMYGLEVNEVPVTYIHDHDSRVRFLNSSFTMARDIFRLAKKLRRSSTQATDQTNRSKNI